VDNLEILKINKIGNVKIQRNKFNIDQMMKLWEEIGFNREKEYVNKVNRIFRGVW
jgi:type II restriction/modification system DNA methylase subunit YeeA